MGNVGADPEMRYTPAGVPVTVFSVAVNRTWTDASGAKQEKTKWFRVNCWRERAEFVAQWVHKGDAVLVQGTVDANAFAGKDDNKPKASLEVTATLVQFAGGGKGGDDAAVD
jgi:single-strand DNA-binding protein